MNAKKINEKDKIKKTLDLFVESARLKEILSFSQWIEKGKHRLDAASSALPGAYSLDKTPYLKAIAEALNRESSYKDVVIMKGVQLGYTELVAAYIFYNMIENSCAQIYIAPGQALVDSFMKNRINPIYNRYFSKTHETSSEQAKLSNNMGYKSYVGGWFQALTAGSAKNLSGRSAKAVVIDEIDRCEQNIEGEGAVLSLARGRTATHADAKHVLGSTPTLTENSIVYREFLNTNQMAYAGKCPHCKEFVIMDFDYLKFNRDATSISELGKPYYECQLCKESITQEMKYDFVQNGTYVETCPEKRSEHAIGFWFSSLYSLLGQAYDWSWAARAWLDAKINNNMVAFNNLVLGLPFADLSRVSSLEHEVIKSNNDQRVKSDDKYKDGSLPNKGLFDFFAIGVDVQANRIEAAVYGCVFDKKNIGKKTMYSLEHRVVACNPQNAAEWNSNLYQLVFKYWEHPELFRDEDGNVKKPEGIGIFVDSQGVDSTLTPWVDVVILEMSRINAYLTHGFFPVAGMRDHYNSNEFVQFGGVHQTAFGEKEIICLDLQGEALADCIVRPLYPDRDHFLKIEEIGNRIYKVVNSSPGSFAFGIYGHGGNKLSMLKKNKKLIMNKHTINTQIDGYYTEIVRNKIAIDVNMFKIDLFNNLDPENETLNYIFPVDRSLEYYKCLCSEELEKNIEKGIIKFVPKKGKDKAARNEALDATVYSLAAVEWYLSAIKNDRSTSQ